MAHIVYLVKGDASIVASYKLALSKVGDFDLVIVTANPDGLSSAYGRLADALYDPQGRICPGLAQRFNALSIPTMVVLRDGEEIDRIVGADPRLADRIAPHLTRAAP